MIQSRQTQTRKKVRFKRDKNEPLVLEREKGCRAMEPGLWAGGKKNMRFGVGRDKIWVMGK